MRAKPVRIQARKVRSTARKSRGVALDSSDMAKAQSRFLAKPQNQYSTNDEKERRGGESGLDVEGAPEEADEEAGEEVADGVDCGEGAEGHTVLFFGDQLSGERIFQRFFGADVKASEDKNHGEQPQGMRSSAEKERADSAERVACGEHGFAAGDMVAKPAAQIGRAGIEDIVQGVEADGEARGAGHTLAGGQHSRRVENQQGVREIAGAEDAYAYEQSPEGKRQRPQTEDKGSLWAGGDGPLADEQPESRDGDKAGQKRPEKNFVVGMPSGFEQPERGEGARDGAYRVHQAFETEGAAVGVRRHVGGEQGFLRGRADTAAQPCGDAAEEHMIGMGCEGERRRGKRGEGVAKYGEGLSAFQAIGVVACGKLCEAGEPVGDALDGAEPDWARADGGQESREHGCGGFVAPVAEEAGQSDAEDGAVEPGLFFRGVGHGKAVYS